MAMATRGYLCRHRTSTPPLTSYLVQHRDGGREQGDNLLIRGNGMAALFDGFERNGFRKYAHDDKCVVGVR